jgi:hypothetical protein
MAGAVSGDEPGRVPLPSENLKKPLSRDNLWRRYMEPKLAEVGLEWATFQVLRRTNASLGEKANVDESGGGSARPRYRGQPGGVHGQPR